jgi:hypothetical protein
MLQGIAEMREATELRVAAVSGSDCDDAQIPIIC